MSIEFGLWRIGGELRRVEFAQLPSENVIENAAVR
jgi:hypothetical protein